MPQSGHALASGGVGSPVSRLSNKHAPFTIACWLQTADILILQFYVVSTSTYLSQRPRVEEHHVVALLMTGIIILLVQDVLAKRSYKRGT